MALAADERLFPRMRQKRSERDTRGNELFLAALSHELRGPLTAVIGWLELGMRSADDPAALHRSLEIALRNARHQASIIDSLLEVSRMVSGKFRVERRAMALARTLRDAVEGCRPGAEERRVELCCRADEAIAIDGDRERMLQVLTNLIGNAIKFNRAGGRVEVRLEKHGGMARIVVTDDGAGIAPAALPYVFEPFWQAERDEARRYAGLGLGLTIVRHIVEQHGGRIAAESAGAGCGATFTVELPRLVDAAGALLADEGPVPVAAHLAGLAVLAVDDHDDTLVWLERLLGKQGAVVWSAGSAQEGRVLYERVHPHLLISDIAMPECDGHALIRDLRARPGGEALGALALTAHASAEERARALQAGYDELLVKPCEAGVLLGTLSALASRAAQARPQLQ